MFDLMSDSAVVEAIGEAARAENIACARRLAAIAELYRRREIPVEDGQGRELWRIDPWESVAAEVAAAQSITPAAAGALLQNALFLHERLPSVAAVFAAGSIDYRAVRLIVARTLLALDPEVLAAIDAELAGAIPAWGPLSVLKTRQQIDLVVARHDPDARRRDEGRSRGRHVDIVHDGGTSSLTGQLHQTDATLLDRRLSALAHSVCERDPRTTEQRRADALGALAAGHSTLACACGEAGCPVGEDAEPAAPVVVHVIAEAAALDAAGTGPLHGARPEDDTVEIITSPEQLVAVLAGAGARSESPAAPPAPAGVVMGGSAVPAAVLADLAARGIAQVRPVRHPGGDSPPEPHYRPSAGLAEFVRCRDLTCRFPGCEVPADRCDLDHTVPYESGGPTHASNLKAACRKHHLLKTFWCGPGGWHDEQYPDGTVVWTSPSGHTYRTEPGSRLFIPALCLPTAPLDLPTRQDRSPARGAMMPRRPRTRAADRRRRILAERRRNADATGPP